jgi:hypothetical protein
MTADLDGLRRSRDRVFQTPPIEWISDRMSKLQDVLEQRTVRSAEALREILGPIRMELVTPDIGRPFYRATTSIEALALTESPPAGAEGGSNSCKGGDGGFNRGEIRRPRQEIRSRPVAESTVDCRLPVAVSSRTRRGASDRRASSAAKTAESPDAVRRCSSWCFLRARLPIG